MIQYDESYVLDVKLTAKRDIKKYFRDGYCHYCHFMPHTDDCWVKECQDILQFIKEHPEERYKTVYSGKVQ